MKKIICVIAAAMAVMSLAAGCSDNGGGSGEITTTASAAPTQTDAEVGGSSEAAPETTPEAGGETAEGAVDKIAEKIKAAYGENYLPDVDIPSDMLNALINLEEDSYTEIFAQQPMISAHPDILIVVKAASGKTGAVKDKLEAYRSRLVEDSFQYPMNMAKVNASKVVANGDYVAFILLGALNEDFDASEEDQAKFAEEQVEIGVKAFEEYFE